MPAPVPRLGMKAVFGPGFSLSTEDDEYQFQFHNLTQVDSRNYLETADAPFQTFRTTFGLPRQWWIFSGRLTKPFEYYVVPAFGFDSLNLLDAFLNIHFDDRIQIKIGRYKTPFTYEFYNLPINALINPERSLFFNNFGLNRDVGIMAWGQMFDKRLDYAVGIFNGSRNFYIDRNDAKDLAAFINWRPFGAWEDTPLENWNIGGSVNATNNLQVPVPNPLRDNVATTGSSFFGVPFLTFNSNVREDGPQIFWSLHSAYYYNHLSVIGEWQSGFEDYGTVPNLAFKTKVPVESFYVQIGYFLTGERVASRGQVRPIRNFDLRPGKFGLGAIEPAFRYNYLHLGEQVFNGGLADPNLWSNKAQLIDLGFNWYWTTYVKLYLGWQHGVYGEPVLIQPGRRQLTSDLLWARFQILF
ncbi:MAG: porin [Isosphaeraceae bacterium]|nr:porin [Isosphaeraceae bacterium]